MKKPKSVITIEIKDTGAVTCVFDGIITKTELLRVQRFLKVSYKEALVKYRRETRNKENTNAGQDSKDGQDRINTSSRDTTKSTKGKGNRNLKVSKPDAESINEASLGKTG